MINQHPIQGGVAIIILVASSFINRVKNCLCGPLKGGDPKLQNCFQN